MTNRSSNSAAAKARIEQMLAAHQASVAQQQQPQRILRGRLKQLANNPLVQRFFNTQNNDGINNTINELNTLFANLSEIQNIEMNSIDETAKESSNLIKDRAKGIIVAYIIGEKSATTSEAAKSLTRGDRTVNQVIREFFELPLEGEVDLAQFLSTETTALNTGNALAFNRLYTVLLAAELLSKEESIPASSPPPNVTPIEVAAVEVTENETINHQLRSRLIRGNENIIYSKIPTAYRSIINSILITSHPKAITEALETAIESVLEMDRAAIEEEVDNILSNIRQDRQSNPRGLRDEEELYSRTLPYVETINDPQTTAENVDLDKLQENFRLVLTIAAYYHSPAKIKSAPKFLDFLLARIQNRPNRVPANTAETLSQLDSEEKVLEFMNKAGLNILEIDQLSEGFLLKIGLPAEIQELIGEKEDYYCPQIKIPTFASTDMPFGTVLINCLVPPKENSGEARKIFSAQLEIVDRLADALGANPSCLYTGIKGNIKTQPHELHNRGFRLFFTPQPNQLQTRINGILDLYQTNPTNKAERRALYSQKINARYCNDRLHPVLEDVLPTPGGELIVLN